MAVFTRRRDDFATTLDTLYECIDRGCFTIRHVALTSDFLLGFHEFLETQIVSLQLENKQSITISHQDEHRWEDLEYYNSIEAAIAMNRCIQNNEDEIEGRIEEEIEETQEIKNNDNKYNIHTLNALEFWNCAIEDDMSTKEILADVIMVFPEITQNKFEKLRLSFNFLDDDTLELLSDALIYLYDLNELRITNNDLTYLSFSTLNNIFNHKYCHFKQTIKILDLSGNDGLIRSHKNGLNAFQSFVDELLINSNITCLRLAQLSLNSVHITYLAKWIIDNHKNCTLNQLDLSNNKCDLILIQSLCDQIINNDICRLESLILQNCIFDYNAADYFGSNLYKNLSLFTLDLTGMDLEGFISFANSQNIINIGCLILNQLQCRSQPNWYTLKMNDIADALINIVINKCLYIQELHLNRGDLNNDEIMDLCAFLCNHPWIRKLVLTNNFITMEAIKSLTFCVGQTKKDALKQTQIYCNNIIFGAELLLFDDETNENEQNGRDGINDNADINVTQLMETYLLQCCNYRINQVIPSNIIELCVKYFYPKLILIDDNDDDDNELFVNFNYQQFPFDLAMLIMEYLFFKPINGLKSILLSGNSLHPTFSACFRNTDLLSNDMLRKISIKKSRYQIDANDSTSMLLTSAHLEKFVRTMY